MHIFVETFDPRGASTAVACVNVSSASTQSQPMSRLTARFSRIIGVFLLPLATSLSAQAQSPEQLAALKAQMSGASAAGESAAPLVLPPGLAMPSGVPQLPAGKDLGAADAQQPALYPQGNKPAKPVAPSQFQRFVQQATGRLLPVFGQDLFDANQAQPLNLSAPAPAEYVLGTGDEVRIQLWGSVDYTGSQTIDRNGIINLPKIGAIDLAGVQVKDLEAAVAKKVSRVYKNFEVSASLGKLRGISVYVVGQATRPGSHSLTSLSTLVNAVFAAGGPNPTGSMRAIELKRGGKTVVTFDMYDLIGRGDKSRDPLLQPGDVVVIPPAGPRMAITGATDHAAIFEIKPGETVQDMLRLIGGVPALAKPDSAQLERISKDPKTPRQVLQVSLAANQAPAALQDGDILSLLPITGAFGNAVTLQGNVAMPLRYKWTAGMKVQDLIPEREALISADYYKAKNQLVQIETQVDSKLDSKLDSGKTTTIMDRVRSMRGQINWSYAVIERLDPETLRTKLLSFDLGKAIEKDPKNNLELLAGDVVTIMSSADLQLPSERATRLVRVEGEVMRPGVYELWPGETLRGLLERVGGLTPQAYVYGTVFTRESVRELQQQNLDKLTRKLEQQMESASANLAANIKGDNAANAGAILEQQRKEMQAQIARLRALRSQGRVSL